MIKSLDELYDYALSFHDAPYIWGGDGGLKSKGGVDCSGLVQLILKKAGIDPQGDQTADGLYRHFLKEDHGTINLRGLGSLAFFGSQKRILHIGFCLDKKIMLEAAGGSSHVTKVEIADKLNARVKIQPINRRIDFVATIMPFYYIH